MTQFRPAVLKVGEAEGPVEFTFQKQLRKGVIDRFGQLRGSGQLLLDALQAGGAELVPDDGSEPIEILVTRFQAGAPADWIARVSSPP